MNEGTMRKRLDRHDDHEIFVARQDFRLRKVGDDFVQVLGLDGDRRRAAAAPLVIEEQQDVVIVDPGLLDREAV